jgi:hypothetical protein
VLAVQVANKWRQFFALGGIASLNDLQTASLGCTSTLLSTK